MFPYVSNDMGKTLAKYHELADTGHILTNTDYEIINARHHDPPSSNSRPQRTRSHSATFSGYDDDGYYDQESEEEDEFPQAPAAPASAPSSAARSNANRRGKRGNVESPSQPTAKRRVTLKMEEPPTQQTSAPASSAASATSTNVEPAQYSANGRPIRRSTLRDAQAGPQGEMPQQSSPAPAYHMPQGGALQAAPGSSQTGLMPQTAPNLMGAPQSELFNNSFAGRGMHQNAQAMPYVSYPAYGLSYAPQGYPSSYLSAGLPAHTASLFQTPAGQLVQNGALMNAAQQAQMANSTSQINGNIISNNAGAVNAQANSEMNGANGNASASGPSSSVPLPTPSSANNASSLRKGNTGLSVMVPEAMKRTALISPLTPTLPLTGMSGILHSPTLTHPAFFPTLPSPSPTTAPSAFGAIFPPFNSTDLFSNLSQATSSNPLASIASNLASNASNMAHANSGASTASTSSSDSATAGVKAKSES